VLFRSWALGGTQALREAKLQMVREVCRGLPKLPNGDLGFEGLNFGMGLFCPGEFLLFLVKF
jgi:hypothetical protein